MGVGAYSRLGAYSRWALIRGSALIRISMCNQMVTSEIRK